MPSVVEVGLQINRARSPAVLPRAHPARVSETSSGPRPAVLMDAPPERMDVRPFLGVQAHLARLRLSVPDVLAAEAEAGLVLLEDFGDGLFGAVLAADNVETLFDAATDALVRLHAAPLLPGLPAWNGAAMIRAVEASFLEWWWPACFGAPAPAAARRDFAAAMAVLLAPADDGPKGFVHRDYFGGNLFWLPGRPACGRVGIIDFQDAAIGHPAYDLAALVQDARRDLPDWLPGRQIERYLAQRPKLDPEAFRAAFAACAAQRHLRVAAQWVRLARRDGKPAYLAHGPRTWRLLQRALAEPAAAPLAAFLDRWIPPERRGNPVECAA